MSDMQQTDGFDRDPFGINHPHVPGFLRLIADLIEAGELRATPQEMAKWAAVQPNGLMGDTMSAVAEGMLRVKGLPRNWRR